VHFIPNAMPFLFDNDALAAAADRIDRLASEDPSTRSQH
jgi:hypothetical protein